MHVLVLGKRGTGANAGKGLLLSNAAKAPTSAASLFDATPKDMQRRKTRNVGGRVFFALQLDPTWPVAAHTAHLLD